MVYLPSWSVFALAAVVAAGAVLFLEGRLSLRHASDAGGGEIIKAQLAGLGLVAAVMMFVLSTAAQNLTGSAFRAAALRGPASLRARALAEITMPGAFVAELGRAVAAHASDVQPDLLQQLVATAPVGWLDSYGLRPSMSFGTASSLAVARWSQLLAAPRLSAPPFLDIIAMTADVAGVDRGGVGAGSASGTTVTAFAGSVLVTSGASAIAGHGVTTHIGADQASASAAPTDPSQTATRVALAMPALTIAAPLPMAGLPVLDPSPTPITGTDPSPSGDGGAGSGQDAGSGNPAAVPEPSTWVAMVAGFLIIGLAVRRGRTIRSA